MERSFSIQVILPRPFRCRLLAHAKRIQRNILRETLAGKLMQIWARARESAPSPTTISLLRLDGRNQSWRENCAPTNGVSTRMKQSRLISRSGPQRGNSQHTNLVATLLQTGGITAPGASQTYGALTAGGASVSRPSPLPPMAHAAHPRCRLQLQDGANNLGTVTNFLPTGKSLSRQIPSRTPHYQQSKTQALPSPTPPRSLFPTSLALSRR